MAWIGLDRRDDLAKPAVTCGNVSVRDAMKFSDSILGRTTIIADGSNIFLGGRGRDFRVDYEAVPRFLGGNKLVNAKFIGSRSQYCRPRQEGFYKYLRRIGWELREFDVLVDGDNVSEDELAVDGEVRFEVRKAAVQADIDTIVLLSGDGGMTNAVRFARNAGKNVFVVAWRGTMNPALVGETTGVAFIDDLRPLIARLN